ncbi:uncharacterized protein LOC125028250 [Penaeus chinensis]|uniref:uncharacterized protein LOC125028250 n=1 Tax=Penaeus chinensis TaxID=139456 RepID=UPI001FB842A4|nr:uncharacterized protein LOC125028250 [Penaeus chinensis]XP_047473624.1 uncharacterized protein LOC125028250 [Penaeus chinensis]XP_047473625.1 uncharacterized protein LOC125028250 [Penaeus chinensis]
MHRGAADLPRRRLIVTRRCVLLSAIAFVTVGVGIGVSLHNKYYAELINSAKLIYLPEMEVKDTLWTMEDIWKYIEEEFLHRWATHTRLGQSHTVGIPRIRLIFTKEGSCAYHVKGRSCYSKIDFNKDTFAQVRRKKVWLRPNILNPNCFANVSAEAMEPRYVDDAEVDDFYSVSCFRCVYPPNGHVVDIPKAVLAGETLGNFETMCVQRIVRKLADFFLDESTRFIQFEFLVHDDPSDLYILITLAFERLEDKNWWPTLRFEAIYIRGLLSRGNYHGFEDDVQMWIIPALVSVLSAAIAIGVLQLVRMTHLSFSHGLKLFLCLLSFIMGVVEIHWGLQAIYAFEEVLDTALKNASSPAQQNLLSLQNRTTFMRSRQAHFPTASFVKYNRLLSLTNSLLPLVFLLQFLLYEDYLLGPVTKIIKSVRLLTERSAGLIFYFFFVIAVLGLMAHITLGECSRNFRDWPSSFFGIIDFFTNRINLTEVFDCKPTWAPIFFLIVISMKFFFLANFLRMCIGLGAEVDRKEKHEKEEKNMFEELEKTPLSQENQECLIMLSEYLRKAKM